MAIRDLENVRNQADKLTTSQQLELAQYLLKKVSRFKVGEEAILSESLLAKDWLLPEEDRAWANL